MRRPATRIVLGLLLASACTSVEEPGLSASDLAQTGDASEADAALSEPLRWPRIVVPRLPPSIDAVIPSDLVEPDVHEPVTDGGPAPDSGPSSPCAEVQDCAAEPELLVCYPPTQQSFKNPCFAQCSYDDALELLEKYSGSGCEELDCPECSPGWKDGGPVCVKGETTWPNAFEACCKTGFNWQTDPEVTPGKCETVDPCELGCPQGGAPLCGVGPDGAATNYENSCTWQLCKGANDVLECAAPCAEATCPVCADVGCQPVCGVDETTYRNACEAGCAKTSVLYPQACCDCPPPAPGDWWCSKEGTTHGNQCELICKQETPDYAGPCIDGCEPHPTDPQGGVCATVSGSVTTLPNAQCAQLAGAACVYEAPCIPNPDVCKTEQPVFDPVCAQTPGFEQPTTFANACQAACSGAVIAHDGLCEACKFDICPSDALPDGVAFCGPQCVLYPNACIPTKCMGLPLSTLNKYECPAECAAEP